VNGGNRRRRWRRSVSRCESRLVQLGSSRRSLGRGSLELEASVLRGKLGLRLGELSTWREWVGVGVLADVGQVSVGSGRMTGGHGVSAEGGRLGAEARSVGSRLAAELSKVKIGTGAVSHVHGLEKASLGVVAVEDDAVEENGENLDDNLDDDANHGPILKTTNECIVNFITEYVGSMVVYTRPTPHVLVVTVVS
jgi:hypothetical protein